jgi:hypothetical protein
MARPPRGSMYGQPRSNSVLDTLWLLVRAVVAYALGFWLYVFLYRFVYALKDYGVGDQSLRSLVFFVLLIIIIVGLLWPVMQEGHSGNARIIGVMTGFVLLVVALSQAAYIFPFDANAPLPEIFRKNFAPWLFNLHLIR